MYVIPNIYIGRGEDGIYIREREREVNMGNHIIRMDKSTSLKK